MIDRFSHTVRLFTEETEPPTSQKLSTYAKALFRVLARPGEHLLGLTDAKITPIDASRFLRILQFEKLAVTDRVTAFEDRVEIAVDATDDWPESLLTITFSSAKTGTVFVRFTYADDAPDAWADDVFTALKKDAYRQKDADIVDALRRALSN